MWSAVEDVAVINRERFHLRVVALAYALEIWKSQHSAYPTTLVELLPLIPKRMLHDPFTFSEEFRYKKSVSGYELYSVGADCKDDGGKPYINSNGNTGWDLQESGTDFVFRPSPYRKPRMPKPSTLLPRP